MPVPGLIIVVLLLIVFFNPELLPRMGKWAGGRSRKPARQARWMWKLFTGTEDESIQAEQDYGHECAREFAKQFSSAPRRADQELAAEIGARLAGAVKDSRREFHFNVVEAAVANAFALPGGFVFITGPLMELCGRDPDEIAFFLGHEMGHVLRGHAKDHMTAKTFLNAVVARMPAAGQMLRHVLAQGYSRTLELEADQEAVRLAGAAGFNARASINALKRLAQISPDVSGMAEYLSSHPKLADRIRALEQQLA